MLAKAGMLTTAGTLISYGLPEGQSVPIGVGALETSFGNSLDNIPKSASCVISYHKLQTVKSCVP
ncbi:MAG TPA: hypothetical protein VIK39_04205 [Candidatus Angelobacter sp.]